MKFTFRLLSTPIAQEPQQAPKVDPELARVVVACAIGAAHFLGQQAYMRKNAAAAMEEAHRMRAEAESQAEAAQALLHEAAELEEEQYRFAMGELMKLASSIEHEPA